MILENIIINFKKTKKSLASNVKMLILLYKITLDICNVTYKSNMTLQKFSKYSIYFCFGGGTKNNINLIKLIV